MPDIRLVRDDLRPPEEPPRRHLISIADLARDDIERLLATARTFARSLERYKKVILYMPTYRDSREDFIAASGIDFARLDEAMREQDALFIFKLHPWTEIKLPEADRYTNLRFAPRSSEVPPSVTPW